MSVVTWCARASKDTTEAAIAVFNSRLDLNINNEHIDRSHRLGQRRYETDIDRPRPVIVKFASYETRRRVFTAKRKLKGTKLVVTENLTKRRSELLRKVRSFDNVECAWTIDGRIICLLADGKKLTVQTERDVPTVRGQ